METRTDFAHFLNLTKRKFGVYLTCEKCSDSPTILRTLRGGILPRIGSRACYMLNKIMDNPLVRFLGVIGSIMTFLFVVISIIIATYKFRGKLWRLLKGFVTLFITYWMGFVFALFLISVWTLDHRVNLSTTHWVTLLFGFFATLIWMLYRKIRRLERTMESLRSEITTKVKEDFAILSERTKDEIGKMEKRLDKTAEKRMTRFDKTAEKRMTLFDAEKARLFAFANSQMKQWEATAMWIAEAIEGYAKIGEEALLRAAVNLLNSDLSACKKLSESDKQKIEKCLPFIPKILKKEKEQIEDKLSKLPKETMEESEKS